MAESKGKESAEQIKNADFNMKVQDDWFFNARLTVVWPIFTGFKIYSAYDAAKENVNARKAEFEITFGEGISKIGEIVDLGVEYEIIKKSGSWFSYGDSKLAQGRDAVKALLKDNPELCEELEAQIMQAITDKA